jgi:hypothetical protein
LLVRLVWPLPSAFMTKISLVPPPDSKTILVPSGDQAGERSADGVLVRFVWPLPSAFMTTISRPPVTPRFEAKAILAPSGDQFGE